MIRCDEVTKIFRKNGSEVTSLDRFTAEVAEGEFVAVRGPSGCGKTTLLLTLGGMQRPSAGSVQLGGRDLYALSPAERAGLRSSEIGFVFQMFHLVPYLDLLGNVLLACPGKPSAEVRRRAGRLLDELGLAGRASHRPGELSAGERQRLAVARALLNRPKLILADEPTGNLDPENAAEVIRHLAEFHRGGGTVVLVTHGASADTHADRTLRLDQGQLKS
ncbi:MAG: ABC transporter ATP-binding protein [Verrucomicrobia bacterium]|nr:ABC transporter ATP-binding protein [Verrucomicrobiota bacterium]MBT6102986.1 ABC transporter ATP-binding protein [Verrucomicrobiota bacterium]MBT7735944.1 ABC transporter ATP-binding protein [Verrucomicrobiota bacterium]MBT7909834.1 ABC transporter ATP-binding protein [Verrucomicrobiota bacterium]